MYGCTLSIVLSSLSYSKFLQFLCMSPSICVGCPLQAFREGHLSIRVGLGCGA